VEETVGAQSHISADRNRPAVVRTRVRSEGFAERANKIVRQFAIHQPTNVVFAEYVLRYLHWKRVNRRVFLRALYYT
jgi:hypothetical protein